jgi:hypothetical protein
MKTKTTFILTSFVILSLSIITLVSATYASNYIYAGNDVVVYPTYVLHTVCHPFMPCGVEKISIPSSKNNNNNQMQSPKTDGQEFYDELSSPGLSQVIKDQNSPTYNPYYYDNYYNNYQSKTPLVIITATPVNYNQPVTTKHFASTYNTRNTVYSTYNQVQEQRNLQYQKYDTNVVVVYG